MFIQAHAALPQRRQLLGRHARAIVFDAQFAACSELGADAHARLRPLGGIVQQVAEQFGGICRRNPDPGLRGQLYLPVERLAMRGAFQGVDQAVDHLVQVGALRRADRLGAQARADQFAVDPLTHLLCKRLQIIGHVVKALRAQALRIAGQRGERGLQAVREIRSPGACIFDRLVARIEQLVDFLDQWRDLVRKLAVQPLGLA